MQSALALLVDLQPADADRLVAIAGEREVRRGDVLLREGEEPPELYVVLAGLVEARLDAFGGQVLGRLGAGELVGEVSWLDERPTWATVRVLEDGLVLAIPRARLAELLEEDVAFAARFHRAVGRLVARRLRARSEELGAQAAARAGGAGLRELPAWRAIEPVLDGLKDLMVAAERAARQTDGEPPAELQAATHAGLERLCRTLREELGPDAGLDESVREEVGCLVRRELHPYLLLGRVVERIYTKPRGYAGDYLTIQWMYADETGGSAAAGALIDRAFLDRPAARAVRNRRGLLAGEIAAALERDGRVTSLACGPAEELFDVCARQGGQELRATLLDIDLQALATVADRRDRCGLRRQLRLEQANLVHLAMGRAKLELPPQDLIYSIGLIDYFQDRFVVALLDWIHERLAPGGKVVLGNFHPRNPDRELMDHVLDWRLIHRDEADMERLFAASRFGRPCDELRFEEQGVNLFALAARR